MGTSIIAAKWREPRDGAGRRKHRQINFNVQSKADAMNAANVLANKAELGFADVDQSNVELRFDGKLLSFSFKSGCGRETVKVDGNQYAIQWLAESFSQLIELRDMGFRVYSVNATK